MLGCSQGHRQSLLYPVLHSPPFTAIFPSFHFKGCSSPSVTTVSLPRPTDFARSSCLHPFPACSQDTTPIPQPPELQRAKPGHSLGCLPRGQEVAQSHGTHPAMCASLAARAVPAPARQLLFIAGNQHVPLHRIRDKLGALLEGDLAVLPEFCSSLFFTPSKQRHLQGDFVVSHLKKPLWSESSWYWATLDRSKPPL